MKLDRFFGFFHSQIQEFNEQGEENREVQIAFRNTSHFDIIAKSEMRQMRTFG